MGEQNITAKKEFSRAGFALLALGLVTTILQLLLSTVFTAIEYFLKIIRNHVYSFIPVIYSFLYRKLAFTRLFMQKL